MLAGTGGWVRCGMTQIRTAVALMADFPMAIQLDEGGEITGIPSWAEQPIYTIDLPAVALDYLARMCLKQMPPVEWRPVAEGRDT